jgi:SPP1 gp7 family putative phage head morphogenesis protein
MAKTVQEKFEKNNEWWRERRAKALANVTDKTIAETEKQLVEYYQRTQKKVIGQFEKTYNKVLSTIAEGKQPTPADLYKLDTYWQMEAQVRKELMLLGDEQAELLGKSFNQEWQNIHDALAKQDGLLFNQIDTEAANQMINSVWCADGKTWSERVWDNVGKLQATLNEEMITCIVAGKKTTELKKALQERFGVSYNQANTLVRTEMAHIQTEAARDRYKKSGLTQVEVWADYDERRCDVCASLHKTKHDINGTMPVPAHPNCRCCILPVLDVEFYD